MKFLRDLWRDLLDLDDLAVDPQPRVQARAWAVLGLVILVSAALTGLLIRALR